MKSPLIFLIVYLSSLLCTGQNSNKLIFDFNISAHSKTTIDSIEIFKSNGNYLVKEQFIKNPSKTFSFQVQKNSVYQFIFYNSCCLPIQKNILSDTTRNNQIIKIDLGDRLINLKELEVNARRDRYMQSGDTLFIFTNPDDTRPHAAASSLFDRVIGLSNDLGRISILGKVVKEVTIDGRKVFGGLPSLSLDAIKADMIEQMEFIETKLGSGQTVNSLNIKLKKNKKNLGYGSFEMAKGTQNSYLGNGRFNKISKTGFFSTFINSNSINQRGIDTKTLDYQRMYAFENSMNASGSVIGLYDRDKIEFNDNLSAFEMRLQGINKYSDAGLNYTLTKPKFEINAFLFGSHNKGNISKNTNSDFLLGDINQKTVNSQIQNNNENLFNSNIHILYKVNSKVTFRFNENYSISKGNKVSTESNKNIINLNQGESEIIGNLNNNNHLFVNSVNSSLIINGKKPGSLTSFLINHNLYKKSNENNFENEFILNNFNFKNIGLQLINPSLSSGKAQINHALPINKRILLEGRFKYNHIKNVNSIAENFSLNIEPYQKFTETNHLFETGVYGIYQKPKLKLISGINYLNWSLNREKNQARFEKKQNFLISPFLKLETKIKKSPVWLRLASEVNLPTWSQVGNLPDSSNINMISTGNIFLKNYLSRNISIGSSFSLKGGINSSLTIGYSKYIDPIISESQFNPFLNIVTYSFINSPNPNNSINANLNIFRIKMNSKFSIFYLGNFSHLSTYQKNINTFNLLKTNLLFNNVNVSYKLNKNSIFKLSWQSMLNWLNNELIFDNSLIFSNNYDLGRKWYIDSKLNISINQNQIKTQTTQKFIDFDLGRFLLKKNNFKTSIFIKNALNNKNLITVKQSVNFQSFEIINHLPRIIGFQLTIYPESFSKK